MLQPLDESRRRSRPSSSSDGGQAPISSRVPPHNLEAEESLIGAMLLSRDAIAASLERCSASDFYRPSHGQIFSAITTLYGRGEPADAVTVSEQLRRNGVLDDIGGTAALVALQSNTPAISICARVTPVSSRSTRSSQADRRLAGDLRARLRPAERRHRGDRPRGVDGLRGRPAAHYRFGGAAPGAVEPEPRPPRGALRPWRHHHRRADRDSPISTSTSPDFSRRT